MAEEDLIFGKMRHLFGGIEPSNMENFAVAVENGSIKITAQLPSNTIVEDQTLCTVAGAVIRRKSTGYPKDEFDGDFVADIKKSGTIIDSNANSTATYYYTAFPYSTKGVYNRNSVNQKAKASSPNQAAINEPEPMVMFSAKSAASVIKITVELPSTAVGAVIRKSTGGYPASPEDGDEFITITSNGTYIDSDVIAGLTYYYTAFPYTSSGEYSINILNRANSTVEIYEYLFGYDLDTTDSDPATRVSYPSDVQNSGYTAAYMDFSAGSFNYGDWNFNAGEKFMPKPCMLKNDGTVDYYLYPDDYTKKENGTTTSDIANTSYSGNAMMEWPKIYTKRWEDENGIYHFRCSDKRIDTDWDCWCNYDNNNNQIDHFYTAIYESYEKSSKLISISGVVPTANISMEDQFSKSESNGIGWTIGTLCDRLLINDLLVMMGKSTNTQAVYGQGNSSNDSIKSTGLLNDKGIFFGYSDYLNGVKVFGMENYWGNCYERIAGLIVDSGKLKAKFTYTTKDGSVATGYNKTGNGYMDINRFESDISGYITDMKTTVYGRIPITGGGSSTTYEADTINAIYNTFTQYPVVVGGCASSLGAAGAFAVYMNYSSDANSNIASRLSCKPSAS